LQGVPQQQPESATRTTSVDSTLAQVVAEPPTEVVEHELTADHLESVALGEPTSGVESDAVVAEEQLQDSTSAANDALESQASISNTNVDIDNTKPYQDTDPDDVQSLVEATFYEEAAELLDAGQQLLNRWFDERTNRSILLQLQRTVHSLKGGARMAELEPVAVIASHL
ncbi:Hpt domain-containing protein, partial [Acinetobacter nosocomialis]